MCINRLTTNTGMELCNDIWWLIANQLDFYSLLELGKTCQELNAIGKGVEHSIGNGYTEMYEKTKKEDLEKLKYLED